MKFHFLLALVLLLCIGYSAVAQTGTWSTQDSIRFGQGKFNQTVSLKGIACADSLHCMVYGMSGGRVALVRYTDDGGARWRTIRIDTGIQVGAFTPSPMNYYSIAFPTRSLALIGADSGYVFRTRDEGQHWDTIRTGVSVGSNYSGRIRSISMHDETDGVLQADSIYRTNDGGQSWHTTSYPHPPGLPDSILYGADDLECLSASTWLVPLQTGPRQTYVMRTEDSGKTWSGVPIGPIRELSFIDSLNGWGAGPRFLSDTTGYDAADFIERTTDGGRSWTVVLDKLNSPLYGGLAHIAFADKSIGLATGFNGKLLLSTNGGETWGRTGNIDTNTSTSIAGIVFASPRHAWAITNFGQILSFTVSPSNGVEEEWKLPKEMKLTEAIGVSRFVKHGQ